MNLSVVDFVYAVRKDAPFCPDNYHNFQRNEIDDLFFAIADSQCVITNYNVMPKIHCTNG